MGPTVLGRALGATSILLLAALVGTQLHRLPELSPVTYLLAAPAALAIGWLLGKTPRRSLAALVAGTAFGLYTASTAAGPVNLRLTDVPYVVLVIWALVRRAREGPRSPSPVGQRPLAVLLAIFGVTLLPLLFTPFFTDSFVSWLRLVQTASLVWLVPYLLDGPADRRFFLQIVTLASTAAILVAIVQTAQRHELGDRLRGANLGPNSIGLLAAVLVVIALHLDVARSRWVRALIVIVGVLGVVMSRSIASIAACGIVLGVFGVKAPDRSGARPHALVTPTRLLLLAVGVLGLVSTLRPNDLPWSRHFTTSSAQARVILATGGLEIFSRNPVLGVGWQQSSGPVGLGSRTLADQLRGRFSDVDRHLFPTPERPGGVHNAYVQVLAESGLVGFSALVLTLLAARRGSRSVVSLAHRSGDGSARTAVCCLVLLLVWWNDNPLYGAQPETVLAMTLLGLLASYRFAGRGLTARAT